MDKNDTILKKCNANKEEILVFLTRQLKSFMILNM